MKCVVFPPRIGAMYVYLSEVEGDLQIYPEAFSEGWVHI